MLQSVCAFKYKKDPLPFSVSLYTTLSKKRMFWLACFPITAGSADSPRDLSLSFLPVLRSKTFSASIKFLMSSQVQLAHMPPLCPTCWPWHQSLVEGPGWVAQAMFMHALALFASSSNDN